MMSSTYKNGLARSFVYGRDDLASPITERGRPFEGGTRDIEPLDRRENRFDRRDVVGRLALLGHRFK